jgi:hypothetical protein
VKVGDLVRFCVGTHPSTLGFVVGTRLENLSITGQGVIYEVLTPDDGVLSLTELALEPVQDGTEPGMI